MVFRNRIADILILSLRPSQLMLSLAAFVLAVVANIDVFAYPIDSWLVTLLFGLYGVANGYCGIVTTKTTIVQRVRYSTAMFGVCLWSVALAIEISTHDITSVVIHILPIITEAWVIAQLSSKVRDTDRRAL